MCQIGCRRASWRRSSLCLGRSDELGDLLGDQRLSCSVHLLLDLVLELLGVVGGGLHGNHSGGQLGGNALLEGAKHLRIEIERHDDIDDARWILLENQIRIQFRNIRLDTLRFDLELAILGGEHEQLIEFVLHASGLQRENGSDGWLLGEETFAVCIHDLDLVSFTREEKRGQLVRDGPGIVSLDILCEIEDFLNLNISLLEVLVRLSSCEDQFASDTLLFERVYSLLGHFDDPLVVRSTKTSFSADDKEGHVLDLPVFEKWAVHVSKLQL